MIRPVVSRCLAFLLLGVALGCDHRDYSAKCPEGWTSALEQCQAPLSYRGPCAAVASIENYSVVMKQQFAAKCVVDWPCLESCMPDYSVTCPQTWMDMGNGICEAPPTYDHHCLKRARMVNEQFKRGFAAECAVRWPCQPACQQDFGRPCPEGWGVFEGMCEAPRSYVGPCAPFANLHGLANQDKAQYAALCQVSFPCQSPSSIGLECEHDAATCPKGWEHKGSSIGICHGVHYQGPCRPMITEEALAAIGKLKYQEMCGVEFGKCTANALPSKTPALQAGQVIHSGPVDSGGGVIDTSI